MKAVTAKSDRGRTEPEGGYATPHRLVVFANSSADAAVFAGGLIFDRVGAGWDVKVYLTSGTPKDERTLRILGIHGRMPSAHFDSSEWPDLLLTGADVYSTHPDIRRTFTAASRRQHTEVAMWGGDWPVELDPGVGAVEHRLSIAARAFKVHAVASAGLDRPIDPAEQFLSGKRRVRSAAPLLPPA
ncbi:hypothetical protein VST63_07050 [Mycolicibacterium sp. 050232]|uniref:hypothetical protein n=1 Tax=Mycolicibacterium sp. 050232 TaxID=3113982 RepID=UPI002E2803F5|nr:hypothetical protein [Mycolicibacterium sp. 050232]MED5812117.1 hypothetical protein [Mycolicibacterium sp. 050232]